jgi:RNA polymerase sigma factor (sigma-70 family)
MAGRPKGAVLKHLRSLFTRGLIGGLSDGQLLEQFAAQGDEDAFAALVERHGPMVVRLCRQVIGDEHEAQDAAQAAFLVLARRAGSIRRRDSVASWLYRVARRVAVRARAVAARRREMEWRGALMAAHYADDSGPSVPQTELYEELDRLAERYRAPLVLCYLEGMTHEQAAQRLRCPVRTVETRLMRGRARLRERLIRRGVVPSAVLVGATQSAPAAMQAAWIEATVRAAMAFTGSPAAAVGMVSAQAVDLAGGVLNVMFIKKLGLVSTSLLILGGLAAGGGVWARQDAARTSPEPVPPIAPVPAISKPSDTPDEGPPRPDLVVLQTKSDRSDGQARELALDDGTMKGKRSIAGGGHAVRFEAPGEGWTLTAVKVHGSRYGYPRPPQEDFKVFLCDEKFQPIAEFAFPYSKFERGEPKWVTLEVKPTQLPKTFILGVDFDPAQTKGVYVSHDKEGSGRSFVGLPKEEPRPFKQGDWLIRAKVAPGKTSTSGSQKVVE